MDDKAEFLSALKVFQWKLLQLQEAIETLVGPPVPFMQVNPAADTIDNAPLTMRRAAHADA